VPNFLPLCLLSSKGFCVSFFGVGTGFFVLVVVVLEELGLGVLVLVVVLVVELDEPGAGVLVVVGGVGHGLHVTGGGQVRFLQ
jgi:hypothetical protein